jgi:homoaconitase/3-isopropylmalate dehydratase large subunit
MRSHSGAGAGPGLGDVLKIACLIGKKWRNQRLISTSGMCREAVNPFISPEKAYLIGKNRNFAGRMRMNADMRCVTESDIKS